MDYGKRHFGHCLKFLHPDVIVEIARPTNHEIGRAEFAVSVPGADYIRVAELFTKKANHKSRDMHDVFQNPCVRNECFQMTWCRSLEKSQDDLNTFRQGKSLQGCVLYYAARNSDRLLKFLMDEHNTVCECPGRYCPLFGATAGDLTEIVKYVIKRGTVTTDQISQAVQSACELGCLNVLRILLQEVHDDQKTVEGGMLSACGAGQTEIVHYLLKKYYTPCRRTVCVCDIGLLVASAGGQNDIVNVMLSHGSDIETTDDEGCTCLHEAAGHGHADTVRFLLERGAQVNAKNKRADFPLHQAARGHHCEAVEVLLDNGADASLRNTRGQTPLHVVMVSICLNESARKDVLVTLLQRGADVNVRDHDDKTARDTSREQGFKDLEDVFVQFEQQSSRNEGTYLPTMDFRATTRLQCAETERSEDVALGIAKLTAEPRAAKTDPGFNILVLGGSAVGKTSFLRRYTEGSFISKYLPTEGIDQIEKQVKYNIPSSDESMERSQIVHLRLWDAAGMSRFRQLTTAVFAKTTGFLLMFDLTNEQSFANTLNWIEDIQTEAKNPDIVLCGNKVDLRDHRVVTEERARELAENEGFSYYETSAATGLNVMKAVNCLLDKGFRRLKEVSDYQAKSIEYERRSKDEAGNISDDEASNEEGKSCVTHICKPDGGVFTYPGTDTKILIPAAAIQDTESIEIAHRTICRVHDYRDIFRLEKEQTFVSPIIELNCSKDFGGFSKRVTIFLPVCKQLCQDDLQVYCHHENKVINIPHRQADIQQDVFYTIEGRVIKISTFHFSEYYACTCNPQRRHLNLTAHIYAARALNGLSCNLRLFLCDELHSMKDFTTKRDYHQHDIGYTRIYDERVNLLEETEDEDTISVGFHSETWKLQRSPRTGRMADHVKHITPRELLICDKQNKTEVGTWPLIRETLENTSSALMCFVHEGKRPKASSDGSDPDLKEAETTIDLLDRLDHVSAVGKKAQPKNNSIWQPLESQKRHGQLLAYVGDAVTNNIPLFTNLKTQCATYIQARVHSSKTFHEILQALESKNCIRVGDYSVLKDMTEEAGSTELKNEIERRETLIIDELRRES